MNTLHPIRIAAKKSGLTPYIIRAWERRYNVVTPQRTDTNRRLYSDEDIKRLSLLRKATLDGESIGQIASLTLPQLIELVGESLEKANNYSLNNINDDQSPAEYIDSCLKAAKNVDQKQVEAILMQAAVVLSRPVFLNQVIEPLMNKIGDLWRAGDLKVLHEHLVSTVVRTILGGMLNTQNETPKDSTIVVTTPAGQVHEFGALLAAVTATEDNWRVIYLGANIPADDIANAAISQKADAIALSMVYPSDDLTVAREFSKLRQYVGGNVDILVGGRAAKYYKNIINDINAIYVESLEDLRFQLEKNRTVHAL